MSGAISLSDDLECPESGVDLEEVTIDTSEFATLERDTVSVHVCTDIECLADNHEEWC